MEKKKTIWAFCLKVVLLVVILFGVDRLVGAAFVKMKDVGLERNPYHQWTKTAYVLEKCDAECVIIGSSRAEHSYITDMLVDSLGMSVYNGGQGGCFFLYQNCIVNMLLDRRVPKKIIWDVQPETMAEYQNVRYLSPYYDTDVWAKNFVDSQDQKACIRMACHQFRYNSNFVQYLMPVLGVGSVTKGGYVPLPTEGYKYPVLKTSPNDEQEIGMDEEKVRKFEATLKRCKEKRVDLTLFVSPSFVVNNGTIREAVNLMKEIASANGYTLYDFSSDNSFLSDSTLFKDGSHLNANGARLYTEKVIGQILRRDTFYDDNKHEIN